MNGCWMQIRALFKHYLVGTHCIHFMIICTFPSRLFISHMMPAEHLLLKVYAKPFMYTQCRYLFGKLNIHHNCFRFEPLLSKFCICVYNGKLKSRLMPDVCCYAIPSNFSFIFVIFHIKFKWWQTKKALIWNMSLPLVIDRHHRWEHPNFRLNLNFNRNRWFSLYFNQIKLLCSLYNPHICQRLQQKQVITVVIIKVYREENKRNNLWHNILLYVQFPIEIEFM